jgi:hypothetical protein
LNSEPTSWATPLILFCVMGVFEIRSLKLFTGAGFEHWSSWSVPPELLGLQTWATSVRLPPTFMVQKIHTQIIRMNVTRY